jgi:aminomethyltransferase
VSRTGPLHDLHGELGAKFTDFGGWSMPLQYESVVTEHMAVRERCGWFDVSHLGRFHIEGSSSIGTIDRQTTISGDSVAVGGSKYGLVLNDDGGIIDDIVIWRLAEAEFIVLPNAANHPIVIERFAAATPRDLRETTAMLAVQGPDAPGILERVVGFDGPRFSVQRSKVIPGAIVAGTGYTGERGGEIIVDHAQAETIARAVLAAGAAPCGLGARDTLRLEAGLPLWGQDMDETTNPYEVGLGFAVDLSHDFIGRDALDQATPSRRRMFTTSSRRIPRSGQVLVDGAGDTVGRVTSGSFSPIRSEGIGMGLVDRDSDTLGIDMRGTFVPVELVSRRFI